MNAVSRFVLIAGVLCGVLAVANVSQAAVVAADTFSRGGDYDTNLGSTETGSYAWAERYGSGAEGDYAILTLGELQTTAGSSGTARAIIDVGLSGLVASAQVRFTNDPSGSATVSSGGMVLRTSSKDAPFTSGTTNLGACTLQITNSGGMLIGELKSTGFAWDYINNPWNALVDYCTYGAASTLPTTINGLPFDADGSGKIESDEPFQLGAILSGTSLQVQINGSTIETVSLEQTSGATGNSFELLKNNLGGLGGATEVAFDNLSVSNVPEPSTLALVATGLLGLLAYAWRKRR